ncbi:Pheromone-regulated membrane protein 10 [Debaryomyces fabryi]|uniref:Pheromone-regulated membrane protein 10 n=1 Tax=Debaryomyces fabryi TaxID=58627 RepID=A0A0V1PW30_9ASCO|nr:Pheromone-regulated membrane protein 10 [Debaryomyces fabryi]KSA00175.1 Pheromone-regulated membrane protein 10 [Debaryomyces fabryi]CUM52165.1 unnamed protein product [Debaryomyces fabryi]
MSNNFARNDISSSSDDEADNYRSQIQIPRLDLANYRKQQKSTSKTNLAKAGKRLKHKSVRFPDLYSPRDTIISNTSTTTNNSSSDSELEPDMAGGENSNLPNFNFSADRIHSPDYANEDEPNDYSDEEEDTFEPPAEFYASEGSDDDMEANDKTDKEEVVNEKEEIFDDSHSRNSRTSKESKTTTSGARNSRKSITSLQRNETDVTDQLKRTTSTTSSSNTEKRTGLKDILRKFALVDQQYPENAGNRESEDLGQPSRSDTFLGNVLSMAGESGGLVPGATHFSREKTIDEEEEVGLENEDSDVIEMKKLDFAQLSNEAQNLISTHVPDLVNKLPEGTSSDHQLDSDTSASNLIKKEEEEEVNGKKDDDFYVPNPDYFIRGDINNGNDGDDYLMLDEDMDNIAPPKRVQAGVLSSLLKLYQNPQEQQSSTSLTSKSTYGGTTLAEDQDYSLNETKTTSTLDFTKLKNDFKSGPRRMANKIPGRKHGVHKQDTQDEFAEKFYDEDGNEIAPPNLPSFHNAKPKAPKKIAYAGKVPSKVHKKLKEHKRQRDQQLRITVHIADILHRQRFIMRMCKALMMFGAPTHRLEEYMTLTSRVLEIDGQFVYFPGCMIVSFGDASTRTSEVHLVRCAQGLNLSKLSDTHRIYKGVIHDILPVDEASTQLEELLKKKNRYSPWICVFLYGLGSSMVCPFAFDGGWYDVPIAFGVGLCVGYLQFFVSSKSNLYSSVFEVTASIVVTFIARAIGSIHNGNIFCFSAIAQGSLALILPGYIILTGSLELQSRNIVAGSVRMFYAIIYSLFLGFGITLGASLYGWVDSNAVSTAKCKNSIKQDEFKILFVPMFSACLGLINQARWRQLPIMIAIACAGYVGTFFAGKHKQFTEVTEFTACIGAFIVGILGNLYSRIGKGMAVAAMLPAIFVQVPSGIASKSSLLAGVESADKITSSNSTSSDTTTDSDSAGSLAFGATMVKVSIGISVGLFASALFVYPFGKKKTGLFSL